MKNYKKAIAIVAAGLAGLAITAQAALTSVAPGGNTGPLSGYALSGATLVAGGSLSSPFSFGTADTGTLLTSVYSGDLNNTLGGYTFVYTISLTGGDIASMVLGGYYQNLGVANLTTPFGSNGATTTGSTSVSYNTFGNITFYWVPDAITPQTLSIVVDTSTTSLAINSAGLLDTGSENVAILAPVPEPATVVAGTLMLLPFGIGAVRSLRKERVV